VSFNDSRVDIPLVGSVAQAYLATVQANINRSVKSGYPIGEHDISPAEVSLAALFMDAGVTGWKQQHSFGPYWPDFYFPAEALVWRLTVLRGTRTRNSSPSGTKFFVGVVLWRFCICVPSRCSRTTPAALSGSRRVWLSTATRRRLHDRVDCALEWRLTVRPSTATRNAAGFARTDNRGQAANQDD